MQFLSHIFYQRYMYKVHFILLTILLYAIGISYTYSQGCSDAGFCTINSFKPIFSDSTQPADRQFKVGTFFGTADNSISVYGTYLEFNTQLKKKFGIDAKITSLAQNGNDISTFGVSDLFINANYKVSESVKLTIGSKIPLSDASRTYKNLPLPMDYQASLGTFDLIFGIWYQISKIQFVAAIQQPLTQNNNQFLATNYPINAELRTFQSTNKFQRSGDVLIRVSYALPINSKLTFTPSILPIYHLKNDQFTDEFNVKREIKGSQGLTLNGNAYLDYQINRRNAIQLNVGFPFIVRDVRPDGLTRGFIANLEYRIHF